MVVDFDASEGVLTAAEVARLFGVSRGTVEGWARKGRIPATRPGGEWRFSAKWVREKLSHGQ